jgi:hypothetical protein
MMIMAQGEGHHPLQSNEWQGRAEGKIISRDDFVKKLIRAGLFVVLAFITFFLGKKAETGKGCSECAGKGICNGESDCVKYLK